MFGVGGAVWQGWKAGKLELSRLKESVFPHFTQLFALHRWPAGRIIGACLRSSAAACLCVCYARRQALQSLPHWCLSEASPLPHSPCRPFRARRIRKHKVLRQRRR